MKKSSKNYLISIVGATAIGKTALSIKLARHFKTEILSSDSRQFYKEMSIGTAVPNTDELAAAKHHFIQNLSISEDYNVGSFERDALKKINALFENQNVVIMVGGSGLYVDAVINGLDYFPDVDKKVREKLNKQLEEFGLENLQEQLKKLDYISYNTIEIDNPHRVIRALEICIGTEQPYSYFKNKPKEPRNFTPVKIGLTADREIMYNRINQRVDIMMENGLLDEVKSLYPFKHLNALQTVGYRELFEYLDGNITLEFAISEIKKNTRRFAKRQGTWFRKDTKIQWFDYQDDFEKIVTYINTQIQ
ncbi:tRNA (adenosine(37)-N6)-dimethylallyltransferase MiaA [Urechidicola croceus]|uniref:tRNA dimethylallyltransferase n=1 Tax=Urechidicola croceus TaxID=1850246 RepID=A0A1D8P545_9FLAO|nr:tRNA (adenosine(37)-N6)-dimethylallyltransferase MiaA [Urechidicola croceus]AOW19666.1 tRNA (adenosine(37)-N6)-dimethylallyltransferase MiaA [Urechidicola croceus]